MDGHAEPPRPPAATRGAGGGRGDHAAARELLAELEPIAADSSEPQLLGPLAVLVTELRSREGELDAARAAVDDGLDRIATCSEEAIQGAAVSAAGVTVEADAAQRARDVGDADAESAALRRVDDLIAGVAAAALPSRPVECAMLLGARAEASRAAGRWDAAGYARAAAAWDKVGRREPAARMRWREAEAHATAGDREAALEAARAAHATAVSLGAGWLRGEIESLAVRARLTLDPSEAVTGRARRRGRARRGGRVRSHPARASGARAARAGRHEP